MLSGQYCGRSTCQSPQWQRAQEAMLSIMRHHLMRHHRGDYRCDRSGRHGTRVVLAASLPGRYGVLPPNTRSMFAGIPMISMRMEEDTHARYTGRR